MSNISNIQKLLKRFRAIIYGILFSGDERLCPLCGKNYKKFGKGGVEKREDSQCMNCGSLERHRFLWLFLERETRTKSSKNISTLHIAPEECLEKHLRKYSREYITSDIEGKNVDIKIDIRNIPFEDETYDLILCSHVLEHVDDDRKALREFLRILKKDGTALILIPVEREKTYEDFTITDPEERLKIFGQKDHVRIYGEDFIERVKETGFLVSSFQPKDLFNENEQIKYGIKIESDRLYVCKKV